MPNRKVEVREYNGSPTIMLNGKPVPPMMINVWTSADKHKDVYVNRKYFEALGKSGIKGYFLSCNIEWARKGTYDLFVKQANAVLEAVPDAYIFLRIGMYPSNEWVENNPGECFTLNTGEKPSVKNLTENFCGDYAHQYCLSSDEFHNTN